MSRPSRTRRVLSLLSGTSADGIDAGVVAIRETAGEKPRLELEWFSTFDFPAGLPARIHAAATADVVEIARLDALLGELFAGVADEVLSRCLGQGMPVDAIASHGQTVLHLPRADSRGPATTLQLGQGDRIAERTGLVTVCDFRQRDLAAGGEGAPLTPFLDHVLFGEVGKVSLAVNLGGILNVSAVTGVLDETLAFDVGPANSILDEIMIRSSGGVERQDRDGARARRGTVDPELLSWFLDHQYFTKDPPKSTGREEFGAVFAGAMLERARAASLSLDDLLATAVEGIARNLGNAVRDFVVPATGRPDTVILSGGGVHNLALVRRITAALDAIEVVTSDALGVAPDGKEALLFALLAHDTLEGRPSNVCSATGAVRPAILGKICPARPGGNASR